MWWNELFCPEHGLMVLIPAIVRYWGVWRLGMRFHIMQLQAKVPSEPVYS